MIKEYSQSFFLAAGECNPQGEIPLSLLMSRVIEMATLHANSWGVGYDRLIRDNHVWVLSRVTIEVERLPRVNEHYSLTTWIEDYNRMFSQRNMELFDGDGKTIGYVRTIWMVIDFTTRESVDLSQLDYIRENVSDRCCPIEPQSRLRPVTNPTRTSSHTFGYIDCDFNRHVNTVRYLDLLLNQFTMDFHDSHIIRRFEISFVKESHYGERADINVDDAEPLNCLMSIDAGGTNRCRARIVFAPRK